MSAELRHKAELRAAKAQDYEAFGGFNLRHIKTQVYELLRHIGEQGIFETYTRHDSAHIEAMLSMLDWVIPEETAESLTEAEWLMIVLSIYVHDLGMLVTKEEYTGRDASSYPEYRKKIRESTDPAGRDYADKVGKLSADERERFLYQEFVRRHHAERIRAWIDCSSSNRLGASMATVSAIAELFKPLDPVFRADLGLVCESHHEDDIDDTNKYPTRRLYGTLPQEAANIQYAAIVLRTVDLLQITRDRTPSIAFRVLNPSDPLSQQEWSKQMAVRAVTSQPKRDRDENVDPSMQADTIEVHASFEREDGFFALTSYLSYARNQLEQSYQWAEESRKRHGSKCQFPWRDIDESYISTKGFLPRQFEFNIDQQRVLDLLTGHTLYNDSSVVLRELTQNAIDAVRLQNSGPDGRPSQENAGNVTIRWNSSLRVLEVADQGTGMTQEIIENNFLRVGSSRYQEEAFRKRYQHFSPISRFGIGVLSTFMLADSVEVITSNPADAQARQISLRSVHGKYLIRLLDKETQVPDEIRDHGTIVRLTLRASAELDDVAKLAKRWFVLPGCALSVQIDDQPIERIGHASVVDALKSSLPQFSIQTDDVIEVREFSKDGVSLAFAVRWSEFLRQWDFVRASRTDEDGAGSLGICIEGVRVQYGTPGYRRTKLLSIANASGPNAPRTNVARSDIDDTPQYERMMERIYEGYCDHVTREILLMQSERGLSSTKAVSEGQFIAASLISGFDQHPRLGRSEMRTRLPGAFLRALHRVPLIAVESNGVREVVSIEALRRHDALFTIENATVDRTESLVRQIPGPVSLEDLRGAIPGLQMELPEGVMVVSGRSGPVGRLFTAEWEPNTVRAAADIPSLEVEWSRRDGSPLWHSTANSMEANNVLQRLEKLRDQQIYVEDVYYPSRDFRHEGLDEYDAFARSGSLYLLPARSWLRVVGCSTLDEFMNIDMKTRAVAASLAAILMRRQKISPEGREYGLHLSKLVIESNEIGSISLDHVAEALSEGTWAAFDVRSWESRGY